MDSLKILFFYLIAEQKPQAEGYTTGVRGASNLLTFEQPNVDEEGAAS